MFRAVAVAAVTLGLTASALANDRVSYFPVKQGSGPHDVAAAVDGGVWYSGQRNGTLGYIDPKTGKETVVPIGSGSSPHGVIVGPDGSPWLTDGGLNANVRYDLKARKFEYFMLPPQMPYANLNTGVFDKDGIYWFTGQNGVHGYVNPKTGKIAAPRHLRHHGHARQRSLVRGACRRPSRQDRQGDRQRDGRGAAQKGCWPAPGVERLQGAALGELLAFR
jgi:streptogramin lyase